MNEVLDSDQRREESEYKMKFPDTKNFRGFNAPCRVECDIRDLEVLHGEIPRDLNGTFYRLTHDAAYSPYLGDDLFVNGDGMISMFRFENGHVDYKSRYVRTDRYVAQAAARRSLFGIYRNRYTNDPSVDGVDSGTANTTPIYHAGKLFALKEDAHPWQVDPGTLETIGRYDFGGALDANSMTAHPKVDHRTGELLFFSFQARGDATRDMAYYVVDRAGKVVHTTWFEAPYPGFVHDFGITDEYVFFMFHPLVTDLATLKSGGTFYLWDKSLESHYALLPRRGTGDQIRWFSGPSRFASHLMNSYRDGQKIIVDLCMAGANTFPFFNNTDGTPYDPANPEASDAFLTRLTFDLSRSGSDFETKRLHPGGCELPRTDDRYQGHDYRHGYMLYHDADRAGPAGGKYGFTANAFNTIAHVDVKDGSIKTFYAGPTSSPQEPIFAPKTPDSPEGEGYIIAVIDKMAEFGTELVILDAQAIDAEPLAVVGMPLRLRRGAHGAWLSDAARAEA